MRLEDAILSGKDFKRKNDDGWYPGGEWGPSRYFTTTDVIATDWIILEERIPLSWREIEEGFNTNWSPSTGVAMVSLKSSLGFTEDENA